MTSIQPCPPSTTPCSPKPAVTGPAQFNSILETMLKFNINEREAKVVLKYQADGYLVLRNGAPDFICLKMSDDSIVESKAVEVKSPSDDLTYEQIIFKKFLEHHSVSYIVEVVP